MTEKRDKKLSGCLSLSGDQIRSHRIRAHHLDARRGRDFLLEAAGACGLQNSPPGAWEPALFNRIDGLSLDALRNELYEEKTLVQAWSFRGAPVVFPVSESGIFLHPLAAAPGEEPWIYTRGISAALDFLHMDFEEVFSYVREAAAYLDRQRGGGSSGSGKEADREVFSLLRTFHSAGVCQMAGGKTGYILSSDRESFLKGKEACTSRKEGEALLTPRHLLLLGAHDPYLDPGHREILLEDEKTVCRRAEKGAGGVQGRYFHRTFFCPFAGGGKRAFQAGRGVRRIPQVGDRKAYCHRPALRRGFRRLPLPRQLKEAPPPGIPSSSS